jgi:hypothetical protein
MDEKTKTIDVISVSLKKIGNEYFLLCLKVDKDENGNFPSNLCVYGIDHFLNNEDSELRPENTVAINISKK